MQKAFAVRPLAEPGFLRRVLKRPNPENGYIELENLLSSSSWGDLHEGHIEKVLRKHGVTSISRKRAKELYSQAVAAFLVDDELSDAEIEDLHRLRNLLGIRDVDADEIERELTHPRYQAAISSVLRDDHVGESERQQLAALRRALRVEERTAIAMWEKTAEPILTRRWQEAVNDRRLSPDEKRALEAMARNFGITVEIDSATRAQLDRFHWYWLMENGTFPDEPVAINLQRNEVCHYSASAAMYEMRTETERINYGGPTVRIKIMKGVYYRVGSARVQRVTRDVLRQIDSGTLYVTSKRIIFDGSRKNTTIRLSNVLSIMPYSDGVEIEKTSGRNPIFMVGDPEWLTVLLSSRLANSE